MTFHMTAPSKTFLLGEYAVLNGGPALVLTTNPRFTLIASKRVGKANKVSGIHPESPTGKMIKSNDLFSHYDFDFIDPYLGIGGLGASSAQFIMLSAFEYSVSGKKMNNDEILDKYLQFAWSGKGLPPSGADIMAQLVGQICYFHKNKKNLQTFSWPFQHLQYCIIHTGNKLATHDHLKQLTQREYPGLEEIVLLGLKSLRENNSDDFIKSINSYAKYLAEKKLVSELTKEIIEQLSVHPDIVAMKGCGAMGADVILIIFKARNADEFVTWVKSKGLRVIQYGREVARGVEMYAP